MNVRFQCGYYSDLASERVKRRPEDYWDAYFYCWAVKVGRHRKDFFIHAADGAKTKITKTNFALARRTFGDWIKKSVPSLGGSDTIIVPVPSKDGIRLAASFRSLDMVKEALDGSPLKSRTVGGLTWNQELTKAHEGGRRSREALRPLLQVDPSLKGKKIILVDDLVTKGSSMLASADALNAAGSKVLGGIVCGKTVYDLKAKHFGEQEFDLVEELADWNG